MASIFDLMLANKVSRDTTASDEVVRGAKTAKELRASDLNNRIKQQQIDSNTREMQEFDSNSGLRELQRTAAMEELAPERRLLAQDQRSAQAQALTLTDKLKRYELIQENLGPEKAVEAMHADKFLPEDAQLEYTQGPDGNEYAAIRFPSHGNRLQILGATNRANKAANESTLGQYQREDSKTAATRAHDMEKFRLQQAALTERAKINASSREKAASLRTARANKQSQPKRSIAIGVKEVYPIVESRLLTTLPDMASILNEDNPSEEESQLVAQFQDLQDRVAITVAEIAGTEPVTDRIIDQAIEQVLANTEPVETTIDKGFLSDDKVVRSRKAVPAKTGSTKAADTANPQEIARKLGLTGKIRSGKLNGKLVFQLEDGSVVDANGKPVK